MLFRSDNVSSLVVPNVFTPNGDNKNDVFAVTRKGIVSFTCKILSRWGKEVYAWDGIEGSWNGKSSGGEELPEGPYMYIINASGIDAKVYKLSGAVQMIRGGKN